MRGMQRWQGKVALVTGASSGIGEAVARRLAADGMRVVAVARRRGRLEALAASHEAITPMAYDLRDEGAIAGLFEAIRRDLGGVDVLVNNAGLGRSASLLTGDTASWREMLEVNVLALCVCTREAIADMRRRGDDGYVIHVSSMAAYRVPPGAAVYSATKFAVRSLTEGLRVELREAGSDIRVTAISPGFVETEFAEVFHRDPAATAATYGHFKVLEPGDIADMVAFALASPPHMQLHDLLVRPTDQGN